jgi:hypothetical protein
MKANELMIGDWVIVYEKAMPVKAKVEGVHGNFATVLGHARIVDNGGNTPYVLPIHLNSDILEKNGFERSEVFVEWKYENDDMYMIYKPFPYLKIQTEECIVAFPCEYVHELQHALKLCQIDKEIVL